MTPSSLNNLTDAEINERIAVALGVRTTETWFGFMQKQKDGTWTKCLFNSSPNDRTHADEQHAECVAIGWECGEVFGEEWPTYFPSYSTSLDAMAEAEATLNPVRIDKAPLNTIWYTYVRHLLRIVERDGTSAMHATAAQRAEAFLDTIAP